MDILAKRLTRDEFVAYVKNKNFGSVPPDQLVLHHTWKPTKASWRGLNTIKGLKNYYEGLGWQAGPHLFVAEDGIWLFTDMYKVGIHAGTANARWLKNGKIFRGFSGPTGAKLLGYSIGIEVVGNYDQTPWTGETKKNALCVLSTLRSSLGIDIADIGFHREFSAKSCPGNAITRDWLEDVLKQYESSLIPATPESEIPQENYRFQFSREEALRAKELGLLQQIDTETREIVAIGLVRLYDKLKAEQA